MNNEQNINKSKKNNEKTAWWNPPLILFMRLSVWIVIPVLMGVFIGKWLDKKYNSEPWFFIGTVGAAFIISMFALIVITIKEYKKIGNELKNKDK